MFNLICNAALALAVIGVGCTIFAGCVFSTVYLLVELKNLLTKDRR